jgi:hypothetical protein
VDARPRAARSGDRIAIAPYLGKGDAFAKAILDSPRPTPSSYTALAEAVKSGRIIA